MLHPVFMYEYSLAFGSQSLPRKLTLDLILLENCVVWLQGCC